MGVGSRTNADTGADASGTGVRIELAGVVQGVGFRPWVVQQARRLGLAGRVWNDGGGAVVEASGPAAALDALRRSLRACELPGAEVEVRSERAIAAGAVQDGFAVAESSGAPGGRIALAPDLATCADCLAEVRAPDDRRYRHPFAACARCGPRATAVLELPYDRARTTMAPFPLCADCRREYEDPDDRRFHAEAIACPACGPRLLAFGAAGDLCGEREAALAIAIGALRRGEIASIQGIGGFHLACDARREATVRVLRARKRRETRPFAVMVRDLAEAEKLACLAPPERTLLATSARPIVLVRLREGSALAPSVAPGLDRVGLLLPYTALHVLLLEGVGAPLVMTSGNRSGEPIAHRLDDALARLAGIADLHLAHDRAIAAPCDDSVAIVSAGATIWIRRSRGRVPRPLRLARPVARPVLGCGAHLHATACLAVGDEAFLSPHLGDLDTPEALAGFEEAVARLEQLAGVRAERVAHDLHPSYATTRWARERGDVEAVAVQHHHAHLAGVLAEHGAERRPALGILWDGTGWGPGDAGDGSAWGGEWLLGDATGFVRLATLRPLALAGGERAIAEPWRLALAALEDAFEGDPPLERLPLFAELDRERVAAVRGLLRTGSACVPAHGAGRWFDAVGSLVLARPLSGYSGEVAMRWNAAARGRSEAPYPFALERAARPWQVDLRPLVRAAVADLLAGRPVEAIAARFHETLAAAAEAVVRAAAEPGEANPLPVALSGGCFQNPLLVERVTARLAALGRPVLRHREVPPGDGGIALGQAVVADAVTRGRD